MYTLGSRSWLISSLTVCLLLGGRAQADEPATLAVLPLEKAAGSVEFDGLGRALSGMLVTDLSRTPGLRLVERAQLDALLTEIHLGSSMPGWWRSGLAR